MQILTTTALRDRGLNHHHITRLLAQGELTRLSRGHYRAGASGGHAADHLARAHLHDEVWGFETAALAHDLPLLGRPPHLLQVLVPGKGRSHRREGRLVHSAPLPADHVVVVNGHRVTSIARTVVDITRRRGLEAGLIPWEAARWRAKQEERLADLDEATRRAVDLLKGRVGIERARAAMELASCSSESPMETRSHLALRAQGLAPFVQQFIVVSSTGEDLGRVDFAWPEGGVLGEYDGQDKYERLARPGETARDVVRREKRRQEDMEGEGWTFARWGKEEVEDPVELGRVVRRSMELASRREPPTGQSPRRRVA